jgi:hypothetical protein
MASEWDATSEASLEFLEQVPFLVSQFWGKVMQCGKRQAWTVGFYSSWGLS